MMPFTAQLYLNIPIVKFGGGNIMAWDCFSYCGTGRLHINEGAMNGEILKPAAVNQVD